MISVALVMACVFCFGIGFLFRDLKDSVTDLQKRMDAKEPDLGATLGTYGPTSEYSRTNQDGPVGLVEAKTPQRVQFDAEEALRREARGE